MLAKGNSLPGRCAANLLMTVRGEVPYERLKGLDAALIDRPAPVVSPDLAADAEWLLETYEPRVGAGAIDLEGLAAAEGGFGLKIGVSPNTGGHG